MVQIMKGTFIFSVAAFSVAIIVGTRLLLSASRKKNVTKRKPVPIVILSGLLGSGKVEGWFSILIRRSTREVRIFFLDEPTVTNFAYNKEFKNWSSG